MRLLPRRTELNMECITVVMSVVLCLEVSLLTLVSGGDVVSPSGYLWQTGSWGKCQGAQCGFGGTQSRVKWCEHTDGWTASESDCDLLSMPESERTCFKVCAHHAELFEWRVEEWGPCEQNSVLEDGLASSTDVTCGEDSLGVQLRRVKCVEKSTSYVQRPHEDFVDSEVCRELHTEPVTSQECITPCAQDCVVTHFTPWSECTSTCGNGTQTRTRQVVIPPSRGGKKCPSLSETQICDGIPSCNGIQEYSYSIKVGPWSECRRFQEDPDVGLGAQGLPLIGEQNREIWCIRNDGAEVKLKKCFTGELAIVPARYQACVIAQDCVVSDWYEWSPCPNACPLAYGAEERPTTYRIRRRQVVALPLSAGHLCPALEEKEPCRVEEGSATNPDECPRYSWYSGGWSSCNVSHVMSQHQQMKYSNNKTLCGGGLHKRDVFCIQVNDTDLIPVNDELCEAATKPALSDKCNVPCPKDCKVTGWGPWSRCKTTSCSVQSYKREKGHKIRTRDVTVQPDIGGKSCPSLAEFVPCDIHMCFEWQTTPVEDCILDSSTSCGSGVQHVDVTCVGPDKERVNDNSCSVISTDKPSSERPCFIPCPDDCVLSQWSEWSECSQSCGKGGTETRRRTVLARPKPGAHPCPTDDELTETRMCNSHSCVVFAWLESEWTECQSVNSAPYRIPNHLIEGITCGIGRQTRTLQCVRVGNLKNSKTLSRCSDLHKPAVSQQCHIPCPVDCVVSEYGEWDPCPERCAQGKGNELTQSRRRFILTHPSNGGTPCPTLENIQRCLIKEYCHQYEWLPSNWGLCKPVSGSDGEPRMNEEEQECGFGLMTRELLCQRADGLPVNIVDLCLRYSDPIPTSSQPCHLPCDEDCIISEWSKWSECQYNCSGEQIRRRRIKGKSRRNPVCMNQPILENRPCVCPSYELVPIGEESDCILDKKSSMTNGDCGKGLSYRAQVCYDQAQKIMPFSYCKAGNEFLESMCDDIQCPYDCKINPWSQWSECSQVEGIGEKIRRRQIITGPLYGGRPCPGHDGDGWLYESKPCQVFNASEVGYYWNAEMWQECRLDVNTMPENATCGFGFQRRTVRCIMKSPIGFMGWTNHTMCEMEPKPKDIRECRKPCSGDCVVGEWAEWSSCPINCNQVSFRHRTREIIRHPVESQEDLCPPLMEQEQCMANINCYEYAWNVTGWSTCELKPGAVCGEGVMIRILQCKEINNGAPSIVDPSICEKRLGQYTSPLEIQCHVRCPIDCLLSEWSEWTKCSDVCGPDVGQSRIRKVLRDRTGLGRPCSTKLQQWRPCKVMPCFQLVKSEWSDCKALDGDCGVGVRVRNVTCVQNDGIAVEDKFCLGNIPYNSNFNVTLIGAKRLERQQMCTIPCPGECQHSQWSSWSKCHIYCFEGRPIGSEGIQARSKAALESYQGIECPGDLIDTRECTGTHTREDCSHFSWQIGEWQMGNRDVWCQRSIELLLTDQLNVTGACPLDDKPNSEARCEPPCLVAHSYCGQNEECVCMNGYETKYSRTTGELQECPELIPDPSLSDNGMISVGTPTYRNADGSGDDTTEKSVVDDKITDKSKDRKANQEKSEANKTVFGHIPVWAFAIGGVFIVFILCLVIAFCCACRSCRKKEDTKKPKENPDDFAIYWDETAKKRYNGEVDL